MEMTNTIQSVEAADVRTDLGLARSRTLYERRFKRPLDVLLGCLGATLALPLGLTIAFAIRVGLGPGVLYSQQRVGLNGEPFTIWKFRTMQPDRRTGREEPVQLDRRRQHKSQADPRHTGLGGWLRRMSLDELPQLANVIRGDMSLVGPRPEVVSVARDRGYIDHVRHQVRPGLTGPYQTSPLRRSGDLRDGLELDTAYVASLSFRHDVWFLLRTIGVLLGYRPSGT